MVLANKVLKAKLLISSCAILKMNESDSTGAQNLNAIPLSDQTKFRPNEINKIRLF